jgi:hypothetical protein
VASNLDAQEAADEGDSDSSASTPAPAKPAVQVDDQLTKALSILKAKAA